MSVSKGAPPVRGPVLKRSPSQCIHRYLHLLGYEEDKHVKVLGNLRVFEHPCQREFSFVLRFLLGLIQGEAPTEECFRDCFPPLDKKQEAEFRRKAFAQYKKLQSENSADLLPVTASLFLTPGGRKFIHFLMALLRWIALKSVRSSSNTQQEVLGSEVVKSNELTSKTKELFLKQKTKEASREALNQKEASHELLSRGKEIIQRMEGTYRDIMKNQIKGGGREEITQEEKENTLTSLECQRKDLEKRVRNKTSLLNQMVARYNRNISNIQALQVDKKEPLSLSHVAMNKSSSLKEYVDTMSQELTSLYDASALSALSESQMKTLAGLTSEVFSKVKRISQKLVEELLFLNQSIIPFVSMEVIRISNTLRMGSSPPGVIERCLLPPTPIVDIRTITKDQSSKANLSLLNASSPSSKKVVSGDHHTPLSRHSYSNRFSTKKSSPIMSHLKGEVSGLHHLEDSNSSSFDLRCLSRLSPVLTSSRMIIMSPSSPETTSVNNYNFSQSEFSSKTSEVLEKYRNLNLRTKSPSATPPQSSQIMTSVDSPQISSNNFKVSKLEHTSKVSEVLEKFRNFKLRGVCSNKTPPQDDVSLDLSSKTRHYEPILLQTSHNHSRIDDQSYSPLCSNSLFNDLSLLDSSPLSLRPEKATPTTTVIPTWMSKLESPREDPLIKERQKESTIGALDIQAVTSKNKRNSEILIGSRLEELIESLGGNSSEDRLSLDDQLELPNFDI